MRKYVFLGLIFLVITTNYLASQDKISAKIQIDPVNPLDGENTKWLFGGFIEFLRDYVNGPTGIWAQELKDRGMDINTCGSVTSCEWEAFTTGGEQSQTELLEGGYNENGRTFQRITVTGENVRAGIRQKVFVNPGKRYESYFYVKTNVPGTKIEFSLLDSEGKIVKQMVREDLPSEWTKIFPDNYFNTANVEMYFALAVSGPGSADFDEASFMPADNIDGIRKEAFDMFREWKMGLLRYPGGWFADREQANFKYGIGPIDKRKSPNIMPNGFNQRMDFGTEEYMKLCRNLDIDPYMVVNLETGTPELARQ